MSFMDQAPDPSNRTELRLPMMREARHLNFLQRLQLFPVRLITGSYPSPLLVVSYKRGLFGKWYSAFNDRSMRVSNYWDKADLELFATFTATQLDCRYCEATHAATTAVWAGQEFVDAVMADWRTAPMRDDQRAALEFLTVFVPPEEDFGAKDIQKMRDAGITDQGIKDVMYASFSFQIIAKLANAFGFPVLYGKDRKFAGKFLARMSYSANSIKPDW